MPLTVFTKDTDPYEEPETPIFYDSGLDDDLNGLFLYIDTLESTDYFQWKSKTTNMIVAPPYSPTPDPNKLTPVRNLRG